MSLASPHLYFWQSGKWVRGLRFMDRNAPGFREQNGSHICADPWREQRYSGDWAVTPLAWQTTTVERAVDETPQITTITFRLPQRRPFRPGQHFVVCLAAPDGL